MTDIPALIAERHRRVRHHRPRRALTEALQRARHDQLRREIFIRQVKDVAEFVAIFATITFVIVAIGIGCELIGQPHGGLTP